MFGSIGIPELLILPMILIIWLLPIAVAVWAVVTLHRIRASQLEMQTKLNALEHLLQRR